MVVLILDGGKGNKFADPKAVKQRLSGGARMNKTLNSILAALILLALPMSCAASESDLKEKEAKAGEVIVWYLGHCGYAVKTENHLLIFDYIELEEEPGQRGLNRGFVDPKEIKDLDVSVFVTHGHVDHYDEVIFSWEKEIKNISYIFGWKAKDDPRYRYLEGPRAETKLDDMEIYTVNSDHSHVPEVAYLVKVDGLVIYHGGDYQGRMGRNAPSNVKDDMEYLKTKADAPDLFFIGAWTGEPYMQSIESLDPEVVFPMHDRKREEKYKQFALDLKELGVVCPVICPEKRGDRFVFRNGKIQ
jgi:L-ascorbate metabolism protein UlaG (beta-lactamase superfamily)